MVRCLVHSGSNILLPPLPLWERESLVLWPIQWDLFVCDKGIHYKGTWYIGLLCSSLWYYTRHANHHINSLKAWRVRYYPAFSLIYWNMIFILLCSPHYFQQLQSSSTAPISRTYHNPGDIKALPRAMVFFGGIAQLLVIVCRIWLGQKLGSPGLYNMLIHNFWTCIKRYILIDWPTTTLCKNVLLKTPSLMSSIAKTCSWHNKIGTMNMHTVIWSDLNNMKLRSTGVIDSNVPWLLGGFHL